jgi:hypothetical protein
LIEQRYAISFPLDDLNTTVFSSLAAVARQVHAMLDPGVTASGGTDQGTGHAPGPATGAIS